MPVCKVYYEIFHVFIQSYDNIDGANKHGSCFPENYDKKLTTHILQKFGGKYHMFFS